MDSDQFDALVTRLSSTLTRRTGLGLIGALGATSAGFVSGTDAKKRKKKKKKPTTTQDPTTPAPTTRPPTTLPPTTAPPFCASQPNGAPCGYCRKCQGGVCQADASLNETSCGSDGTGRCWEGTCNPKPTCVGRFGSCQTVAQCCSAGSTHVPTTCDAGGTTVITCHGRSDTGQPCHGSTDCWSGASCDAYVCREGV